MIPLDNLKTYHQFDEADLYSSLTKMGRQIDSGWTAAKFESLGFDSDQIHQIILTGMGGSNLAGHLIHSLAPFLLTVPYEIIDNYRLPSYAAKNTLVILSSYSGDTEEILSCAQDAKMRGCLTLVLTTGGKLLALAGTENISVILLDKKLNPSGAPRAGLGLSIGALMGLFLRLNPLAQKYFDQKEIIHTIDRVFDMVSQSKNTSENPAKSLAVKHKGLGVIIFSANHLSAVGKTGANFLNETAKTMSVNFNFPDLNHHLLEGFTFPLGFKDQFNILILNSSLYPEIIQKRISLTRDILLQQKYRVTVIKPETTDPVCQVFESLVFLIMFSYYLSITNKVNPAPNPWVDYLKKHLH